MRYPLWAFLFLFVLPPFALHALLTGGAKVERAEHVASVSYIPSAHQR